MESYLLLVSGLIKVIVKLFLISTKQITHITLQFKVDWSPSHDCISVWHFISSGFDHRPRSQFLLTVSKFTLLTIPTHTSIPHALTKLVGTTVRCRSWFIVLFRIPGQELCSTVSIQTVLSFRTLCPALQTFTNSKFNNGRILGLGTYPYPFVGPHPRANFFGDSNWNPLLAADGAFFLLC